MTKRIGRRKFIRDASIAAAGISLSPLATRAWGARPVFLFLGFPLTGGYASLSKYIIHGMELAIEDYGGSVLGRPVNIIQGDASTPEKAVKTAREAVENLGCRLLTVAPSSNTVLAVSDYAKDAEVVLMGHGGSDKITGEKCNKYTFRWPIPTWGAARTVLPVVIDQFQARTFYAITPNYIFGDDLLRNTEEVLCGKDCMLLGNSYHPVGAKDYSRVLAEAEDSGADCILLLNFGDDTVNCLMQAYEAGISDKTDIVCVWGAGIQQMTKVAPHVLEGVFWGLQYYYTLPTEKNRQFVKSYKARYGEVPTYLSATVYSSTTALLGAVDRAGTDEPYDVVAALEGHRYMGLTGREEYRVCDHQCVKPFYVVRCKRVEDMRSPRDYAEIVGYSVNLQPCGENGCGLGLFRFGS